MLHLFLNHNPFCVLAQIGLLAEMAVAVKSDFASE